MPVDNERDRQNDGGFGKGHCGKREAQVMLINRPWRHQGLSQGCKPYFFTESTSEVAGLLWNCGAGKQGRAHAGPAAVRGGQGSQGAGGGEGGESVFEVTDGGICTHTRSQRSADKLRAQRRHRRGEPEEAEISLMEWRSEDMGVLSREQSLRVQDVKGWMTLWHKFQNVALL